MAMVSGLSGAGNRAAAILATTIAVAVPLSAVPMASNRSALWLLWSALFGLFFLISLMRAGVLRPRKRLPSLSHRFALMLACLVPVWAIIQVLPLSSSLPVRLVGMPPGLEGMSSMWISLHPDVALSGILRFAGYLFLGIMVVNLATRRDRVLRMATLLYAGVVAQALWALVSLNLFDSYSPWGEAAVYRDVATGTFVNRNSLATFLGFGIVLGIGLVAEKLQPDQLRPPRRGGPMMKLGLAQLGLAGSLILVGLVVLSLALIQTQSRLGLTATVIGALVTIGLARGAAGISSRRLIGEALGLVLLLALGLLLAGGGVLERFLFVEVEGFHRWTLYSQALEMIRVRPWTGYGMDAFGPAFEAFRGPELDTPKHFDLAHNTYLTLWAEFGLIVGSAPLLLILLLSAQMGRRLRERDGFPRLAMVGVGAVVLAAVHSLGDFSLEIPANAYLFVTLVCLAIGRRGSHVEAPHAATITPRYARTSTLAPTLPPTLAATLGTHVDPASAPDVVMAPEFRSVRSRASQVWDPE